tara:strand:- start:9142 stop:10305 length:1164 start_codon:yes stop_codon:yes gene_type:complete
MKKRMRAMTGAEASAFAMKQINPDVVAAYPITPQTPVMQKFSQYVADGEVNTEFVRVESEHSAMSACVGASAAGARVMTATASAGLALMFEIVGVASGSRLPIVMSIVNRALSAPINIHCDHGDSMGCRDLGWIQFYCETAQEAYEYTILAIKLAEHKQIQTPVMVCQDGFITSHCVDNVITYSTDLVRGFIGEYKPKKWLLNTKDPFTVGPLELTDYYFETKRQQTHGIMNTFKIFPQVAKELRKITQKRYDYTAEYKLKDAEVAIVAMSSTCGIIKEVVDKLRKKGKKVGLLKVRMFRPFPYSTIRMRLDHLKSIIVMDRSESFGARPPLYGEVRNALYKLDKRPKLMSCIYGLGGRDIYEKEIEKLFNDLLKGKEWERRYVGVR